MTRLLAHERRVRRAADLERDRDDRLGGEAPAQPRVSESLRVPPIEYVGLLGRNSVEGSAGLCSGSSCGRLTPTKRATGGDAVDKLGAVTVRLRVDEETSCGARGQGRRRVVKVDVGAGAPSSRAGAGALAPRALDVRRPKPYHPGEPPLPTPLLLPPPPPGTRTPFVLDVVGCSSAAALTPPSKPGMPQACAPSISCALSAPTIHSAESSPAVVTTGPKES